ncbi:MAG: 50S ribosomal protein L5 [Chloroflexota bacterium]
MPRLREKYLQETLPAMREEFKYDNVMQVPRLVKAVVNVGLGEAIANAKALDAVVGDITAITGQKPVITRAKKSVAAFKVRTGMPIGVMVTLRGDRMFDFLDKLMNIVLPRIRDFQGISPKSFDGRGNFSLGMQEQIVFPEIEYDKVDKIRGLEITVVTTARSDEEARRLLQLLGMPFRKS